MADDDDDLTPPSATQAQPKLASSGSRAMDDQQEGSNYLADQRARFGEELKDPGVRSRLRAVIAHENESGPAVAESLMNRMSMTGGSLMSPQGGMTGGGNSFYGPVRKGQIEPLQRQIDRDPARQAKIDGWIDQALAGSNVTKGHTDQGSYGDPNFFKGGVGVNINGERYNHWGGFKGVEYSQQWTENQQRLAGAGGTSPLPVGTTARAGYAPNNYNTTLPDFNEKGFQSWMRVQSKAVGRDLNEDLKDYDMRGFFARNGAVNLNGQHLTDMFKKPNHPTFSSNSIYEGVDGNQGGVWIKDKSDGSWDFYPGKTNRENMSREQMQDYFDKVEPGNRLRWYADQGDAKEAAESFEYGSGDVGTSFMRAGKVPKVGELSSGPSKNIERRTGPPIAFTKDAQTAGIADALTSKQYQELQRTQQQNVGSRLARDLGVEDIRAQRNVPLPRSRPKRAR